MTGAEQMQEQEKSGRFLSRARVEVSPTDDDHRQREKQELDRCPIESGGHIGKISLLSDGRVTRLFSDLSTIRSEDRQGASRM